MCNVGIDGFAFLDEGDEDRQVGMLALLGKAEEARVKHDRRLAEMTAAEVAKVLAKMFKK